MKGPAESVNQPLGADRWIPTTHVFVVSPSSYTMAHIWACPPSEGDDYIFHCHPPEQRIPKPKRLQDWYKKMLDKAIIERVVIDYKVRRGGWWQRWEGVGVGGNSSFSRCLRRCCIGVQWGVCVLCGGRRRRR